MGSQVITQGRKRVLEHLNNWRHPYLNLHILGSKGLLDKSNLNADHSKNSVMNHMYKGNDLETLSRHGPFSGSTVLGSGTGRIEILLPSGAKGILQLVRFASTAAARKADIGSGDEHEDDLERKLVREAPAKDCDHTVENLCIAKSKVKTMKIQKSQLIKQMLWARLLGVAPAMRAVGSCSRAYWALKFRHWKNELLSVLNQYWLGSKLLLLDVVISSRLLLRLASGKQLSRRERRQLTRTTADIFKLVPFAVFVVVPFMEFLLPVFLRLFPNMLPSTFNYKKTEQEALIGKLKVRMEYAKFLQDTVKEMTKAGRNLHSGEIKETAEDLDQFINKVRTGACVDNNEIFGFAKLFNDELILDNMDRSSLINMCKYVGTQPDGTDNYLRFMLRRKLKWIRDDDILLQREGVDSLSEYELRQACRERGYLGLLSTEEMRQQLRDWLDLSLNHAVPSSLLILSRAFTVSGNLNSEGIGATLSSLPGEILGTVATGLPSENTLSERRRKLEFLEMQEELIKEEENVQDKATKLKETEIIDKDTEFDQLSVRETEDLARKKMLEKQEELCKISRALALLASASSVSSERQEFLSLVNKEIELYNLLYEGSAKEEAEEAYKAARERSEHAGGSVSSALINKVNAMLQELAKEIEDVDATIGNSLQLLDRDHDGKVTAEELAAAAIYLKDNLGKAGIEELISNLSKDKEGKILVEDIVKLGTRPEADIDEA